MRKYLLALLLIHLTACTSSPLVPTDSGADGGNMVVDSDAVDLSRQDVSKDQPFTCSREYPGCPKLILDGQGCPIGCDVQAPTDTPLGDRGSDGLFDAAADRGDAGADASEAGNDGT